MFRYAYFFNKEYFHSLRSSTWCGIYLLSIATPFVYIYLYNLKLFGPQHRGLLDVALIIVGFYCLLAPFFAMVQLFGISISTHKLTGEKILRLLLTYFYMLFAFSGIYLVAYFHSDVDLARQEFAQGLQKNWSEKAPPSPKGLALSGVASRLLEVVEQTGEAQSWGNWRVQWRKLPEIYLDMLYFSMATLTTLGFGDIVAKSPLVKIVVMIEALFGNLLLVLGVSSIVPRQQSKP